MLSSFFKKALLIIGLFVTLNVNAQKANTKSSSIAIGPTLAFPVTKQLSNDYNIGAGVTLKYTYATDETVAITASTGYIAFPSKVKTKVNGSFVSDAAFLPTKVGYRYTCKSGYYIEPQIGLAIMKDYAPGKFDNENGFIYSLTVGYKTGDLNINASYDGISYSNLNGIGFFGVNVSYNIFKF